MDVLKKHNRLISETYIKNCEKRNFEGYYFDTKKEAVEKIKQLVPEKNKISWGGSKTIDDLKIKEYFVNGDFQVIDSKNYPEDKKHDSKIDALKSDYYFTSSNGVSLTGELVNVDGTGNRVAALAFGPKNIIVVIGTNKIEKNLELATQRARNLASPLNSLRYTENNPCGKTGICNDCKSEECICCSILITRFTKIKGRIKIIIIGEKLGF